MKKLLTLACIAIFSAATAALAAGSGDKSSGGASGGSDKAITDQVPGGMTGGSDQGTSTATVSGMTGGAAGQDVGQMKDQLKQRLDKVNSQIDQMKSSMDNMPDQKKQSMQLQIDKIEGQRDGVKKMIDDVKAQQDMAMVQKEMSSLEKAVQKMSSSSQRSTPAGDQSSGGTTGGSTGGASDSSSMDQGAGGATGGADMSASTGTATDTMKAAKTDMNKRLEKVNRDLKDIDKIVSTLPADQQASMKLKVDQLKGDRDGVKRMIKSMKNEQDRATVDAALTKLDQSTSQMKSGMLRTSPAGDKSSGGTTGGADTGTGMTTTTTTSTTTTGGITGGTGTDSGTSTMTAGGMTGGAQALELSYDQRDQFIKTQKTKLDGFDRRIDMLEENARKAPQNINSALMPKVGELRNMSTAAEDELRKVKDSKREDWNTTKVTVDNSMSRLERALMQTEQMVR